jgi:putative oxidoreductase
MYHGYDKFTKGIPAISGFMDSLGLPLPTLMAYLLTYGELVGGVLLIVGLCTYWVSLMDIVIALVALFTVHFANGFSMSNGGYEYIMLILAGSISIFITGAGKYSLDAHMAKETTAEISQ